MDELIEKMLQELGKLDTDARVEAINGIKQALRKVTPFPDEPVDCRVCKSLLRNDFWCKGLSFTQQKSNAYERYLQMMKQKREEDGQMSLFTA